MWYEDIENNMSKSMSTKNKSANKPKTIDIVRAGMVKRRAAEQRFKLYGKMAIGMGLLFLALLFGSIVSNGYQALCRHTLKLRFSSTRIKLILRARENQKCCHERIMPLWSNQH